MNSRINCSRVIPYFLLIALTVFPCMLTAQNDTITYKIDVTGSAGNGKYAAFWLQSNRYGKIPSTPVSAIISAAISKEYGKQKSLFHYGFKTNVLMQSDLNGSNIYFHELAAKAQFYIIDLIVGSHEEILGNQDSTLSSGGLLFSQNARPIPKITIGVEHFRTVPFTFGYLEIKGGLSHGWFTDNTYGTGVLLHHKYLYARVGGKLPVHLQYGLDHGAQWGGALPGLMQQPQSFNDFKAIFLGHSGGSDANINDRINALGNHIISQSVRLDADICDFRFGAYWQIVNEDGPIRFIGNTMNKPDGLWGITLKNRNFPLIQGLIYEYLNTTDQSGPYHDKDGIIYGGADTYFNNSIYLSGWSFYNRTIGTPFITSTLYNAYGSVYIKNNRVRMHHFGFEGSNSGYRYKLITSVSYNYGLYSEPFNSMKKNTSILFEINKHLKSLQNIEAGISLGADFGKMYGNAAGCLLSIRKTGDLFHY